MGGSPEKISDQVCCLHLVQGNLVFDLLLMARKSVLKGINGFNHNY